MFQRYAIFYTPQGALAERGAAWLGWDIAKGREVSHPSVPGLEPAVLTRRPRRYGLHGTIKAPFFLAPGADAEAVGEGLERLCARQAPVVLAGLEVQRLGGFVALIPMSTSSDLSELAAAVVTGLDTFRAAPSAAELAQRRKANLTESQERNLMTWGYPYVMQDFRFHITLTGHIKGDPAPVVGALQDYFAPFLAQPFLIDALTLAGQDEDGRFHEIKRFGLSGA